MYRTHQGVTPVGIQEGHSPGSSPMCQYAAHATSAEAENDISDSDAGSKSNTLPRQSYRGPGLLECSYFYIGK